MPILKPLIHRVLLVAMLFPAIANAQHAQHEMGQTENSPSYRMQDQVMPGMNHDHSQMQTGREPSNGIGKQYVAPNAIPVPPEATSITDSGINYSGQHLSLPELISIAQANNPTLRQASLQIDGTMGKAIQAGLYPNPTLRYSAEQIGVGGTPGEFHGGIISQEIVRGGKLRLSRAKFLERVKVAEANALAQQFRVTNDVSIHFYQALAWQHRVEVQQELVKSAEDSAVTAREAFAMGQANAADIRRINVSLQKARLQLLQIQNMLRQTKRQLSALVGAEVSDSLLVGALENDPLALDFESLLSELWASSPELIAARAKMQSDRITVQREYAERISNVTLEGGAGYNFEAGETTAVAGVSLPIKIFDRNQGTIQQAQADLARQCAEIERIQDQLRRDLAMEYENYLTSSQHVQQYQQVILPELKETYRLLLESYKDNRTDWIEVLLSQTDYFTSRMEYYDWLAKFRRSEVLIDGMLLHGGLMAAEGTTPPGHIDAVAKPR